MSFQRRENAKDMPCAALLQMQHECRLYVKYRSHANKTASPAPTKDRSQIMLHMHAPES
jgi:hypothetical protein